MQSCVFPIFHLLSPPLCFRVRFLYTTVHFNRTASNDWPEWYARSASQIDTQLTANGYSNYRILTGGILGPEVNDSCSPVQTTPTSTPNISFAKHGITWAEDTLHVAESHLGISVHPYGDTTNQPYYFTNFRKFNPSLPIDPCSDLYQMLVEWRTHDRFQNLPIFFTETNWTAAPAATHDCYNFPGNGPGCSQFENGQVTSYLVDLFTWLRDRGYTGAGGAIRVLWFRPADDATNGAGQLGLYDSSGNNKYFNPAQTDPSWDNALVKCPAIPSLLNTYTSMATVYTSLVSTACYDSHGN